MTSLSRLVKENGLSLTFLLLFVGSVCGQALCGQAYFNATQAQHGLPAIALSHYLKTGHFLQGMFENWQAAILQLATLILFGVFLRQKGAPHSLQVDESHRQAVDREEHQTSAQVEEAVPGAKRNHRRKSWLARNSLSVVFFALFAVAFAMHLLSGHAAYNEQQRLEHQATISLAQYSGSSAFWFVTFQTWEAEFMAIVLYLMLSIFLRQEGSPESKPDNAADAATGETNQ